MSDQNVESCKKSAAKCVDKCGQEIAKLLKQADDELAKVRDSILERLGKAYADLGNALAAIKVPAQADAKELEKIPAWPKKLVNSKVEPLRKYVSIDTTAEMDGASKKLQVTGSFSWKQRI